MFTLSCRGLRYCEREMCQNDVLISVQRSLIRPMLPATWRMRLITRRSISGSLSTVWCTRGRGLESHGAGGREERWEGRESSLRRRQRSQTTGSGGQAGIGPWEKWGGRHISTGSGGGRDICGRGRAVGDAAEGAVSVREETGLRARTKRSPSVTMSGTSIYVALDDWSSLCKSQPSTR